MGNVGFQRVFLLQQGTIADFIPLIFRQISSEFRKTLLERLHFLFQGLTTLLQRVYALLQLLQLPAAFGNGPFHFRSGMQKLVIAKSVLFIAVQGRTKLPGLLLELLHLFFQRLTALLQLFHDFLRLLLLICKISLTLGNVGFQRVFLLQQGIIADFIPLIFRQIRPALCKTLLKRLLFLFQGLTTSLQFFQLLAGLAHRRFKFIPLLCKRTGLFHLPFRIADGRFLSEAFF